MISDPTNSSADPQISLNPQKYQEQSFHFVEPQNGKQRRGQERRDVRSFVMQRARRERPWSTSKRIKYASFDSASTEPTGASTSKPAGSSPKLRVPSRRVKCKQSVEDASKSADAKMEIDDTSVWLIDSNEMLGYSHSPQQGVVMPYVGSMVGRGMLDPFASYPIDLDARSLGLVEHYVSVLAHEAIPVDIRRQSNMLKTQWFALAMSHRAFMHSLLATAAMHAYTVGKASYHDIMHHKSLAIEEININLSDPISSIDDGNIAAVFCLLCVEESMLLPFMAHEGEGQAMASTKRLVHVSGMKRMIELRGGLTALGMNQCLQALIIWHVAVHSVTSFLPPYLPLPDYNQVNNETQENHRYRGTFHTGPLPMLKHCFDLNINQDLASLLDDLYTLAVQLGHFFEEPQAPFEPLNLQTRGSMIQVRLLGMHSDAKHLSTLSPLENTVRLTALIFTVLVFQSQPSLGVQTLHPTALEQLVESLTLTQPSEWAKVPGLLLWVLVIGAIGARGSPRLPWFLDRLSLRCLDIQVENANDVIDLIRPLLWIDRQLNGILIEMWHDFVPRI